MSGRLSWFKFHPSDWLSDERVDNLVGTWLEGAFIRVLARMWKRGEGGGQCAVPDDDEYLSATLRVSREKVAEFRSVMVNGPLAVLSSDNGQLVSKRLLREFEDATRQQAALSLAGTRFKPGSNHPRTSPRARRASGSGSNSNSNSESSSESESESEGILHVRERAARFDSVWASYPVKRGKQDAVKAWGVLDPSEELTAGILADVEKRKAHDDEWLRGYAPRLGKYLRQKLWTDEIARPRLGRGGDALVEQNARSHEAFVARGQR